MMWPITRGRRVRKTRYTTSLGNGLIMEFDEYKGALAGLYILEVEFPSENAARNFVLPEGISGKDVTVDKRFKNKNLSEIKGVHELGL